MEYVKLGSTDLNISRLCLGTMQFGWSIGEAQTQGVLSASFGAGINFFDTADVYSNWLEGNPGGVSETYLGNWIKKAKIPRDKIVIATKVRGKMGDGPDDQGLGRSHIMQAVEASLMRLQTDYIDLYQAHSPDENTPIEETLRAFNELLRQGKVRYIGASNYKAWELMQALWTADKYNLSGYICLQPKYNLIQRAEFEAELRDVCKTYGLGVIPYSPLRGGFLTGKYIKGKPMPDSKRAGSTRRFMSEKNLALLQKMADIGKRHTATIAQVALAWLLADSVVTSPIIGATSEVQMQENLGALDVKLTKEEMSLLNNMTAWKKKKYWD
jgi:aryl-alcohol dehydrogenase-like predicted oxidoreductase